MMDIKKQSEELQDLDKEAVESTKKLIAEQQDILSKTPLGRIILQAMEKTVQDE